MARILVTLISSPETTAGRRALALAGALTDQGHALTLCCLQDAVLLGSSRTPGESRAGLEAGARASAPGYPGLAETLAAGHDRVIGAL